MFDKAVDIDIIHVEKVSLSNLVNSEVEYFSEKWMATSRVVYMSNPCWITLKNQRFTSSLTSTEEFFSINYPDKFPDKLEEIQKKFSKGQVEFSLCEHGLLLDSKGRNLINDPETLFFNTTWDVVVRPIPRKDCSLVFEIIYAVEQSTTDTLHPPQKCEEKSSQTDDDEGYVLP